MRIALWGRVAHHEPVSPWLADLSHVRSPAKVKTSDSRCLLFYVEALVETHPVMGQREGKDLLSCFLQQQVARCDGFRGAVHVQRREEGIVGTTRTGFFLLTNQCVLLSFWRRKPAGNS